MDGLIGGSDSAAASIHGHYVEGQRVVTANGTLAQLVPTPARPVPPMVDIATESDAWELLDRCAMSQASWLAIGPRRRLDAVRGGIAMLRGHALEWAEAAAEDSGVSCEVIVGAVLEALDAMAVAAEEPAPMAGLHRGLTLFRPGKSWIPTDVSTAVIRHMVHGSSVVVLPNPSRGSALHLVTQVLEEAGLPIGAMSVITADPDTQDQLVRHPAVAGVVCLDDRCGGMRAASGEVSTPIICRPGRPAA